MENAPAQKRTKKALSKTRHAFMPTAPTVHRRVAESAGLASRYPALLGLEILLVEDEALVAAMVEDVIEDLGGTLAGTATTLSEALAGVAAAPQIHAAILDVNLAGEMVFPVADVLVRQGVPIVFST